MVIFPSYLRGVVVSLRQREPLRDALNCLICCSEFIHGTSYRSPVHRPSVGVRANRVSKRAISAALSRSAAAVGPACFISASRHAALRSYRPSHVHSPHSQPRPRQTSTDVTVTREYAQLLLPRVNVSIYI